MTKNNTKFLLILIVLLGLVLRVLFFSGVGVSDDLAYSKYAYNINKGIDPNSVLTLSTRIGILYPTALSYYLFGVNDFSSIIFILLTAIGNIILAYFFGRLLGNKKIGLMASFLMAIFPLDVLQSTQLFTDLPASFFLALGIYFFLCSEKNEKDKLNYFLSGVFIGIGYLIRESTILIALFFILYSIYKKKIKKEYFLVFVGFALLFGVEVFALYQLTNEPFFKFTKVQDYLLRSYIEHNYFNRLLFPSGLFHYPYMILTNQVILYFYMSIFIAITYIFLAKKRKMYILLLWFLPLLLYLSFGSSSFTKYLPFKAVPRYLSIITMPGILLLSFFLSEKGNVIKKIAKPLILLILFITSLLIIYSYNGNPPVDNLKVLYPSIAYSKKTVYSDSRSKMVLEYLSGYKGKINLTEYPEKMNGLRDVYVIVNKPMMIALKESDPNLKFPDEIENPPNSWEKKKVLGNGKSNAVVYYVP